MSIKVFIFDLDGTLTPSKLPITQDTVYVLSKLIEQKKVAVTSGSNMETMRANLLFYLKGNLDNLYLFPCSGAEFFEHRYKTWNIIYRHALPIESKYRIIRAFNSIIDIEDPDLPAIPSDWGDRIEDRHTQISFSALGQKAPLSAKQAWDPEKFKRTKMVKLLKEMIPEFNISIGGTTSIDVTQSGIDKGYAIRYLLRYLDIKPIEAVYVGDSLGSGGNDEAVLKAGVICIPVKDYIETTELIKGWLI